MPMKTLCEKKVGTIIFLTFHTLPDEKILALPKLEAFADDNFIVAQMVQFFSDRSENIVGKGESAGY